MIRSRLKYLFLFVLCIAPSVWATELVAPECDALEEFEDVKPGPTSYGSGLLWKISKAGTRSSYVFGTIHVADDSIVDLPAEVNSVLAQATSFAMEVVPDASELMTFASLMYFTDGNKLSELISKPLFNEVVRLLIAYHLPEAAIALMKPWAAFLTLSYPPEAGQVLDMRLLETARQNGADVSGLESLQEQAEIFDTMALDMQVKILSDTACHYDVVEADYEKMKSLYIARDLAGLYAYSQRYSTADGELYNGLMKKLLTDRNYTMAKRMQPMLEVGNAFIAVGAMHLPGAEGVLSLLAKNGYEISRIY